MMMMMVISIDFIKLFKNECLLRNDVSWEREREKKRDQFFFFQTDQIIIKLRKEKIKHRYRLFSPFYLSFFQVIFTRKKITNEFIVHWLLIHLMDDDDQRIFVFLWKSIFSPLPRCWWWSFCPLPMANIIIDIWSTNDDDDDEKKRNNNEGELKIIIRLSGHYHL